MKNTKIQCYATYDIEYSTWNVMQGDVCLHYGDIDSLETWITNHKDTHIVKEKTLNEENQ